MCDRLGDVRARPWGSLRRTAGRGGATAHLALEHPRNRSSERRTSSLTGSMPITSSRPTSSCSGRYMTCGERPGTDRHGQHAGDHHAEEQAQRPAGTGSIVGRESSVTSSPSPVLMRHHRYSSGTDRPTANRRSREQHPSRVSATSGHCPAGSVLDRSRWRYVIGRDRLGPVSHRCHHAGRRPMVSPRPLQGPWWYFPRSRVGHAVGPEFDPPGPCATFLLSCST